MPAPQNAWKQFSGVPRSDLEKRILDLEAEVSSLQGKELHWRIRAEVSEGLIEMFAEAAQRS